MIHWTEAKLPLKRDELAEDEGDIRVRVINCGEEGCLLETMSPLPEGAEGTLHVSFAGRMFEDVVKVVRCLSIAGAGSLHHVAVRFLTPPPPYVSSPRSVIQRDPGGLSGSFRAESVTAEWAGRSW